MRVAPKNEQHAVPTIRDIAALVGVHKATVSAVLNGGRSTARVSEATRKRIIETAKELRYSPNAMARGLKMVRFKSLGLAFNYQDPSWITSDQYGTALLTGIIMAASRVGYNITHFYKAWQDAEHSAAGFRGQGIDGFLIIAPVLGSDIVHGLSALGIPLVVISAVPSEPGIPSVRLDNPLGIRLALEHLFHLGHRKIAYISGASDQFDALVRRETYFKVMAEAGIPIAPGYFVNLDDIPGEERTWDVIDETYGSDSTYRCMQRLLRLPDPPTAVITAGAGIAEPVLYAARDTGVRVPEELS